MDGSVKASTTWKHSGGCEFARTVQTKITHEDIFIKPENDEIVCEDRAVLLNSPETAVPCELQFSIFPRYKIESLSMVCNAPKLEFFVGPLKEYTETIYGTNMAEDETNDKFPDDIQQLQLMLYRYDIEVQKSGVVELTLKLLPSSDEVCIFGILMQIAPNPNGITTLLPTAINLDNVQQMLNQSNQKLSPSAEKCKMFMQMYGKSGTAAQLPTSSGEASMTLLAQLKNNSIMAPNNSMLENVVKTHIDMRLLQLENKLIARLDAFELQQSAKLDTILKILQTQ